MFCLAFMMRGDTLSKYTSAFVFCLIDGPKKKNLTIEEAGSSGPANPFHHFLPAGFFAIKQDAGTVNFAGKPGGENKTPYQQCHRKK